MTILRSFILSSFILVCIFFVVLNIKTQEEPRILPSWAEQTLQKLSVRQKLAQLLIISSRKELPNLYIPNLILQEGFGGVLFLGHNTIAAQHLLIQKYQSLSKIPLLMCLDAEWGVNMRLDDAIALPRNMTLGAIQDENLLYQAGEEIGRQCKALGIHVNFAPVVDINSNKNNPIIGWRAFSDDPFTVARCAIPLIKGMQSQGIITCAKHFPGHGDTTIDSHRGLPVITFSKEIVEQRELIPFKKAIEAGVDMIMLGHLSVPALDAANIATFSSSIVHNILQKELGFKGLIITDALNMQALSDFSPGEREVKAFLAGADLLLCPAYPIVALDALEDAYRKGMITEQEIDKRVLKILHLKEKLNLQEKRTLDSFDPVATINRAELHTLKQNLYENAITVQEHSSSLVPLSKDYCPLLVQIGGLQENDFIKALQTSLKTSTYYIPSHISEEESFYHLNFLKTAPCILFGIFDIDRSSRSKKFGIPSSTLNLIKAIQEEDIPLIITLFGSPYTLELFQRKNTFIIAYEDDPEAQKAAAHIILGKREAKGKLPLYMPL